MKHILMKRTYRILTAVLVTMLALATLPLGAAAADVSQTVTDKDTITINDTVISTVDIGGTGIIAAGHSAPETTGTETSVQIALSPNSTGNSVTLTLNPPSGTATTISVTLDANYEGTGSVTISGKTYTFNVSKEGAYAAPEYGNSYIAALDDEITLTYTGSGGTNIYNYTATTTSPGFPQPISLRIIPDGIDFDNINSYTYTYDDTGATLLDYSGTYFLATFPTAGSTLTATITYPGASPASSTYVITLNYGGPAPSAGTGIYAYLPAPGQYSNEGITKGGWGDAFLSGSTGLKGLVNAISATGVSLGSFGGYVVLDMGEDIANSGTNPYGVDFIVYGNAFSGNSEPGCIQVAEGAVDSSGGYVPADVNGDSIIWYDIAGSLHYEDNTAWNAAYTYTNPHPADDVSTTPPQTGTVDVTNANNNVPYAFSNFYRPGETAQTGNGVVTYNAYHKHAWFPLNANYFTKRGGLSYSLDRRASLPFINYIEYAPPTEPAAKLTLNGVMLGSATSTATANYAFGYADVHPNGSNVVYGTAQNPYAATASTSGGDGIDISWAVNKNGEPVNLTSIRFVRIYSGSTFVSAALGEMSSEICGVYAATGVSSGLTAQPTIRYGTLSPNTTLTTTHMGTENVTFPGNTVRFSVSSASSSANIYVNSQKVTSGQSLSYPKSGTPVQLRVIVQDGDGSPYITLVNFN